MEDWTESCPYMKQFRQTLAEMNQYMSETDEFIAICEAFKAELETNIKNAKELIK